MKETDNGVERFDGIPVVQYEGKFSGAFDLPDELAIDIGYDDVVSFVVTARAGKSMFDATKFGDMKRTNAFNVVHVAILDGDVAKDFYDAIGGGD